MCCLSLLWIAAAHAEPPLGYKVEDFVLSDASGKEHRLTDWRDSKLVVLVFLGTECPLVKSYAPRLADLQRQYQDVRFVGINANHQDAIPAIAQFAREHKINFPIVKDVNNVIADRLGAQRTPEVFLLDQERTVRYHGRIDDQYAVGVARPKVEKRDLALAIDDLLAGRPVRVPQTEAAGCFIGRLPNQARKPPEPNGIVTFSKHIAPVLHKHCVSCHRPGSIAPFSLLSYRQAAGWSETIREVLASERMPPWLASPRYGKFVNQRLVSDEEKKLIDEWIRQGVPEGDKCDLPPPPVFSDDWRIPTPDQVVSMPEPFDIPAEGVIDYQYIEVDPGFTEDKWIQAAEVRPGNRAVLHHSLIFLKPPGFDTPVLQGNLQSVYLTGSSAGSPPLQLPAGMAKKIPAGWKIVFQMHYTTTGTPQRDRSSLGLVFADPRTVQREVATNMVVPPTDEAGNFQLRIPPHADDEIVKTSKPLEHDLVLLSLSPHMHLRGKSFRFEAHYPDGGQETLLDIPRYDFGWQDTYYLAEPKLLPRGTVMHCTAHFDNSARNLANPDPAATVLWGPQSWDEMMIGYYQVALADQDLTRPIPWSQTALRLISRLGQPSVAACLVAGLWLLWRRYLGPRLCLGPHCREALPPRK